jgi:hypothetical protein
MSMSSLRNDVMVEAAVHRASTAGETFAMSESQLACHPRIAAAMRSERVKSEGKYPHAVPAWDIARGAV